VFTQTTAARDERREQARQAIKQAAGEHLSEDGFRRWIEIRSRFHRYSMGNTLLIAAQCPDASQVAGYKSWQKLGRQVRKGEKAIRILAPIVVKKRDEESGEERRAVVGFRGTCVFDVKQTDGDDLPAPPACAHAEGDDLAGYLPALEAHARSLGFAVEYKSTGSAALGYCDSEARRIVVSDELSANATFSVLVHELAHAHGLGYRDHGRAECETIVEATTAIVLGSLGFDPSGFSIPYIATWARDEEGLEALERFASTIDETARKLEDAIKPASEETNVSVEEAS
jgi:antirestriction protein ArdC